MFTRVRLLTLVLLATVACQSLGVRENLTPQQLALIRADSEAFVAVVREENKPPATGRVDAGSRWWVDARPYGKAENFPEVTGGSTGAGDDSFFAPRPDSAMMTRLTENRKRILAREKVKEGKEFSYPKCRGTLAVTVPGDPPPSGRPAVIENYLTVGIPVRGQLQLLQRLKRPNSKPVDLSGEVWITVVDKYYASPGGQNWFQYAYILKRDPATRQLGVAATALLSWAE